MKRPNYSNEILKSGRIGLVELPGFSGYFVDMEDRVFSCVGLQPRQVAIWKDKTKAGYVRERVHLHNDMGKGRNMSYKKVLGLAQDQRSIKQQQALGELF